MSAPIDPYSGDPAAQPYPGGAQPYQGGAQPYGTPVAPAQPVNSQPYPGVTPQPYPGVTPQPYAPQAGVPAPDQPAAAPAGHSTAGGWPGSLPAPPPNPYGPAQPAAWPAQPTAQPTSPPAPLGSRVLARVIDGLIVFAAFVVLSLIGNAVGNGGSALSIPFVLLAMAIAWGYEFFMIGQYGQTFGKRAMGLRVVKMTGEAPGWGSSALRAFIPSVASLFTCGLGGLLFYLSPLFDSTPWKRGWYDQVATTVVTPV